ncbi:MULTISPECIES: hypothetical protein [unclassified Fusibacter]|uniref:hypothetical protein n=1 Tax=unclassified Fusibacter TaxID=2624464 RepID=UPI001011B30C|nr:MULTISPECIES: hypothetical protein [unclassified Fusibacter]MCK8060765.1 hypothetical protein [Fusibacter sp. A2]NPE23061.1 hypothetical protein [Fusibacter sp. A1]RXV59733.1 hypothetical protein DWB64_14560 [Fusibacter sp. A1]
MRLIAIILIVLLLFTLPVNYVANLLGRPPSKTWHEEAVVTFYEDQIIRKYAPIDYVKYGDNLISVGIEANELDIRLFNKQNAPVDAFKSVFIERAIWQLKIESVDERELSILTFGDYVLYRTRISLVDGTITSDRRIAENVIKFDGEEGYVVFEQDSQIYLLIPDGGMQLLFNGNVNQLELVVGENYITVVDNRRDLAKFETHVTNYRIDTHEIISVNLTETLSLSTDNFIDAKLNDGLLGVLLMRTDGSGVNEVVTYKGVVLDENLSAKKVFELQNRNLKKGALIIEIRPSSFDLAVKRFTSNYADYFRLNTESKLVDSERMTRSLHVSAMPLYVKSEEADYFYWINVKSGGKELNATTTSSSVIDKGPDMMDYLTSAWFTFASAAIIISHLALPYFVIILMAIYLCFYFEKKYWENKLISKMTVPFIILVSAVYMIFIIEYLFVKNSVMLAYLPTLLSVRLGLYLVLAGIFLVSAVILKLAIGQFLISGKYAKVTVFTLSVVLLYIVTVNIYVPIDYFLQMTL